MAKPTKKLSKGSADRYAKLLASSTEAEIQILSAFELLGFDEHFVFVSALVEQLASSFNFVSNKAETDEFIQEWASLWSMAKKMVGHSPTNFPAQNAPDRGFSKSHPVLIAFAKKVPVGCDFVHYSRVLLFRALMTGKLKRKASNTLDLATQLRLCTVAHDPRSRFIKTLQLIEDVPFDECLQDVIKQLDRRYNDKTLLSPEKRLVDSLSAILSISFIQNPKKNYVGKAPKNDNRESELGNQFELDIDPSEMENQPPISGKIHHKVVRYFDAENPFDPSEPILTAEVNSTDDPFEANDIANLNRSLRWLHNTRSVSPSSPRRYNRIERLKLLQLLRSLHESEPQTAFVFYCLYLLGLSIDDIWSLKFGCQYGICKHGVYHKDLPELENSYTPPREILNKFEQQLSTLTLELPVAIKNVLNTLPTREGSHITQEFSLDRHQMKDRIQALLHDWRKLGNTRFHYNRLSAALSAELMIINNDPLITYLLSGSDIHLSPTLRFYKPTSQSKLQSCWKAAMKNLTLEH